MLTYFATGDKMRKITLENIISFLKLSVILISSWPLPITATKWQIIRLRILYVLHYINVFCLFVPLLVLLQDGTDREKCIKSYSILIGCFHCWLTIGICYGQQERLQVKILNLSLYNI